MRVGVADRLRRSGNRGNPALAVRAHRFDQVRAPVAMVLVAVVHGI